MKTVPGVVDQALADARRRFGLEVKTAAPPAPARPQLKALPFGLEVKETDDQARTFVGLAATWDLDLGGDLILKGAFRRTIADWKKSKKGRVHKLIDSHNRGTVRSVVGKLLDAEETDEGVLGEWGMIDGPDGDEAYRRVKGGYVDSLSIGYQSVEVRAPSPEQERAGVFRILKELKWLETSLVIFPMNEAALIDLSTVKHLLGSGRQLTAEELQDLKSVDFQIRALLAKAAPGEEDPPAPSPAGLAPEDPARVALEAKLRTLTLRRLGGAV